MRLMEKMTNHEKYRKLEPIRQKVPKLPGRASPGLPRARLPGSTNRAPDETFVKWATSES